jgi:O-antigen biosynthesis protein
VKLMDIDLRDCVSPASFWKPDRIVEPHSWIEHIPFAFWVVGSLQPSAVVELGSLSGNSFFAFCQAAMRHHTKTRLTAIDTWQGDEHAGSYGEEIFIDFRRYRDAHFCESTDMLRCTFDAARPRFASKSIDLLHIDGLHTYEAVRHDFETWLDAMSDRGVVLFHDTAITVGDFGVWRLWEELSHRYLTFEFKHGNGLGVLSVGGSIPDQTAQLFELSENEAATLRSLYSCLGRAICDWEREAAILRRRLFEIETSRSWKISCILANAANFLRRRRSAQGTMVAVPDWTPTDLSRER